MCAVAFTPDQLTAIQTTGREVLVSAAAGSGKTAVLAERCAYLVCDAPPGIRCGVHELLVLTFTDAAAAEMRGRIVDAIARRVQARPGEARLREQLALADAAQICTVHSFCLWVIRRWFATLGIDPNATVLSAEEAALLQHEAIDALFSDLYSEARLSEPPAEWARQPNDPQTPRRRPVERREVLLSGSTESLARRFVRLVDDYGLGSDAEIGSLVLRLDAFTGSLPDPDAWLRDAHRRTTDRTGDVLNELLRELSAELALQAETCERFLAEPAPPGEDADARQVGTYLAALRTWLRESTKAASTPGDRLDAIRTAIAGFSWPRRSSATSTAAASDTTSRERTRHRERIRKRFESRLKTRFGLFTSAEWAAGLECIRPFVATLVDLVATFREVYRDRKESLRALDFADLERLAYGLLRKAKDTESSEAADLRARFHQVLVDEFQDINPLQEAIIRAVCRQDHGRCLNLFAVGDIKQSIYRFRLAEPAVFAGRLRGLRADHALGRAVFLQSNFRSRPEILEAVNLLFRPLMRDDFGGVAYDERAELRTGRSWNAGEPVAVQLHLVERQPVVEGDDESDGGENAAQSDPIDEVMGPWDPARWQPLEREAFVIGRIISGLVAAEPRKFAYRDMVVLLRSAKVTAARVAAILNSMGIPTATDGAELLHTVEIRDVLAGLQTLDNPQQDIPLASVLRNGLFGVILSEDELVAVRCIDRRLPFHRAVSYYAERGSCEPLRETLRRLFRRIDRFRDEVRRRPVAEVLTDLYERHGYAARVAALPRGRQRLANLFRLHELARTFGGFRKQGLPRFLQFLHSLDERDLGVRGASASAAADDAVRILTVHQSKGLEFPVVFVAGLGTHFNLRDRNSRMIFERSAGIGLRVVNRHSMTEYRSALHLLAAAEIERTAREEEMRILYVAMTRAMERLVLVGSIESPGEAPRRPGPGQPPARMDLASARTPLDWLLPAIAATPGLGSRDHPILQTHLHRADEIAGWRPAGGRRDENLGLRRAAARLAALPPEEPVASDDVHVAEVAARLRFAYPMALTQGVRSVRAAGEFKGVLDYTREPDTVAPQDPEGDFALPGSTRHLARRRAMLRGTATHRVLQHLSFVDAGTPRDVEAQIRRMVLDNRLTPEEREAVDVESIAWFLQTPLADAIRRAGANYLREVPFIGPEHPSLFDPSLASLTEDFVLVRGIVDGILPDESGVEVVDFKTDAVTPIEIASRVERYRPQMTVYARAIERLWRKPVRKAWLVFLEAKDTVGLGFANEPPAPMHNSIR